MRRLIPPLLVLTTLLGAVPAHAYWVWVPKVGKWVNPKSQPKETPEQQLAYAQGFYEAGQYPQAVREFLRLVRHYPKSFQAPDAQFAAGQCYEAMRQPAQAFQMYQQLVQVYPYSGRFKEAIARSFAVGVAFAEGQKVRPLQPVPLAVPAYDKAVAIFEFIVAQAPYGEFGDQAQFRVGQTYRKMGQYGEALKAFEKLVQEYRLSPLMEEARYNVAFCAKQISLKPGYDQESTDQAIAWFEEFIATHPDSDLLPEAERSLAQLRGSKAEAFFRVAEFYARQRQWPSAARYFRRILDQYGETPWAAQALARLTALEQQGRLPTSSP